MKMKKLVSAIAALAMATSAFAGLATTAQAASSIFTSDWGNLGDGTIDDASSMGTGWSMQSASAYTLSNSSGEVSFYNANNNNYLYYAPYSIEDGAGKIYKYSFDYKTNTGTNTGNNASNIATLNSNTLTNYSQFGSSTNPVDLGTTNTSTTYHVDVIIDNVKNVVLYKQGETTLEQGISGTNRGVIFRPGRGRTDYISNFTAYELAIPTVTVKDGDTEVNSDTAAKVLSPSTSAEYTITTENAETVVVDSDNKEAATATYSGGKLTVTGVDTGSANITVTAKGTDDYETASVTFSVQVMGSSDVNSSVRIQYRDAATQTKELKDDVVVSDGIIAKITYNATDEQMAEFDYTDPATGVKYKATLNADSPKSVTPEDENEAVLTLLFDLEEYKYDATIETVPYAAVQIAGTSTSGTTINESVYTDYLGKATANLVVGTGYTVTITKSGYNPASGTLNVTADGGSVAVATAPSEDGVQFSENFSTAGITNGFYGTQAGAGNNNVWSRIDSGDVQFIGGGSGPRDINIVLTYTPSAADIYTLTYDQTGLYDAKPEDRETTVTTLDDAGHTLSTLTYMSSTDGSIVSGTVNGTALDSANAAGITITVKVNTVTGEVTTYINEQESTIIVEGAGAPKTIKTNLARNHRWKINNIKVTGETVEPEDPDVTVEFKSRAEFLAVADEAGAKTGTLHFLSSPKLSDPEVTITGYGFRLIDVSKLSIGKYDEELDKPGSDTFKSGDTIGYNIEGITESYVGSDVYAVPYVKFGANSVEYGTPFGGGEFDWSNKLVQVLDEK